MLWNSVDKLGLNWWGLYLTHHEYSRLTNTSLGLTPTTYFLSVRFWRLSKVSILELGYRTLPTPGVFPSRVWNIQSSTVRSQRCTKKKKNTKKILLRCIVIGACAVQFLHYVPLYHNTQHYTNLNCSLKTRSCAGGT